MSSIFIFCCTYVVCFQHAGPREPRRVSPQVRQLSDREGRILRSQPHHQELFLDNSTAMDYILNRNPFSYLQYLLLFFQRKYAHISSIAGDHCYKMANPRVLLVGGGVTSAAIAAQLSKAIGDLP